MRITDAERQIMEVLWDRHPMATADIIERLAPITDWRTGTVKALINRLLKKSAISAVKQGRHFLYSPVIAREACVTEDSRQFLDRWFDGRLAPLVAHLSDTNQLDARQIDELYALISELKDES